MSYTQKCSVKFGSRLALMAHLKEKHTKKGKLYECDKKFLYTTSLKRHKQCDHEEEGETFQCVLCPHVAPRKEHLNRHYELVHKNATLPRKKSVKNTAELSERQKRRKAKELNNNLLNEQDAEIKKFVFKEIIKDDVVK